jgi:hypothetical protein
VMKWSLYLAQCKWSALLFSVASSPDDTSHFFNQMACNERLGLKISM